MSIPVNKNRQWVASLHESINQLGEDLQVALMKPVGIRCASDLLLLCENQQGKKADTIEDLICAWNDIRNQRGLKGKWEFEGDTVRGIFHECGCPLVRSGMIELHPLQCYCSQGMMETVFSKVMGKMVPVEIQRSIARGDDVCEFVVNLKPVLTKG